MTSSTEPTTKSRWLSPDTIAIAATAAGGGLLEALDKLAGLGLSIEDMTPVLILVGLIWIKETVRDLIRDWRQPGSDEQIMEVARRGAADVVLAHREVAQKQRADDLKLAAQAGAREVIEQLRQEKP